MENQLTIAMMDYAKSQGVSITLKCEKNHHYHLFGAVKCNYWSCSGRLCVFNRRQNTGLYDAGWIEAINYVADPASQIETTSENQPDFFGGDKY